MSSGFRTLEVCGIYSTAELLVHLRGESRALPLAEMLESDMTKGAVAAAVVVADASEQRADRDGDSDGNGNDGDVDEAQEVAALLEGQARLILTGTSASLCDHESRASGQRDSSNPRACACVDITSVCSQHRVTLGACAVGVCYSARSDQSLHSVHPVCGRGGPCDS